MLYLLNDFLKTEFNETFITEVYFSLIPDTRGARSVSSVLVHLSPKISMSEYKVKKNSKTDLTNNFFSSKQFCDKKCLLTHYFISRIYYIEWFSLIVPYSSLHRLLYRLLHRLLLHRLLHI